MKYPLRAWARDSWNGPKLLFMLAIVAIIAALPLIITFSFEPLSWEEYQDQSWVVGYAILAFILVGLFFAWLMFSDISPSDET